MWFPLTNAHVHKNPKPKILFYNVLDVGMEKEQKQEFIGMEGICITHPAFHDC